MEINDFEMHKSWYERVLRKCDLLDNKEADLSTVWRKTTNFYFGQSDVFWGSYFEWRKSRTLIYVWEDNTNNSSVLEHNNILLSCIFIHIGQQGIGVFRDKIELHKCNGHMFTCFPMHSIVACKEREIDIRSRIGVHCSILLVLRCFHIRFSSLFTIFAI